MNDVPNALPEAPPGRSAAASVARNTGASTLAQVITALAGYALLYLAAVKLGQAGVGVLSVILSVTIIGQVLAALGLDIHLARLVAAGQGDQDQLLGRALMIVIATGVALVVAVVLLSLAGVFSGRSAPLLRIAALAIVPGAVAVLFEGLFMGRERVELTTLSNTLEAIIRLCVAVPLLLAGWGLASVAAAIVVGRLSAAGIDLFFARRFLAVAPQPNLKGLRALSVAALPLSGIFVLGVILSKADVLLLARLNGEAQAGLLAAGSRPVEVVSILPVALIAGLYPVLSRQLAGSETLARRSFDRTLALMGAVMAGFAIGLSVDADVAVRLLYPHGFEGAAPVLAVSAWYLLPLSVDATTTALILAQARTRLALALMTVGTAALVGGNLLLDPHYGALGAALARLAATSLLALLNAAVVLRGVGNRWLALRLAGIAGAGLVFGLMLRITHEFPVIGIPAASAAYAGCLLLFRVVAPSELRRLLSGLLRLGRR